MSLRMFYSVLRKKLRSVFILGQKKKKLTNTTPTIISSDCTGGSVYNELNLQFRSPTINMFFLASDFIRFCSDIRYWVDQPMIEIESDLPYPVATLGKDGIKLFLVHYNSVEEAQEKWNARKERMNYDNLFFIMNDRNCCSHKDMVDFDHLPSDNKVLFTHVQCTDIGCSYHVRGFERKDEVPVMTHYVNKLSIRKNLDCFNFVKWLNKV